MTDVVVRLTAEQILEVAGQLSVGTSLGARLYQISHAEVDEDFVHNRDKRLSLSLLRGLALFALLSDGEPLGVNELAARCRMTRSTTHRYLATLTHVGLVGQEPQSRKYVRLLPR